MGQFCAGEQESKREGVPWPAGARGKVEKHEHESKSLLLTQPQVHPMPPWSSAQLDLVVPTAAEPRAAMDEMHCGEDGDS